MPSTINGLPLHPLIVHATVVFVPMAALAVLLYALWPAARRRLGVVPPVLALIATVLVPLSSSSGENLQRQVHGSAAVQRHIELADGLLPWMLLLLLVSIALTVLDALRPVNEPAGPGIVPLRRLLAPRVQGSRAARRLPTTRAVLAVAAVLALVAGAGTFVQVVRIGDSGAKAAWGGVANQGGDGS